MKSNISKTATAAQPANAQEYAQQPFFQKDGQGAFFSEGAKQKEAFFNPSTIQPKLHIGKPNDPYEQEADAMAEKVVQQLSDNITQQTDNPDHATNSTDGTDASPNGHGTDGVQTQTATPPDSQQQNTDRVGQKGPEMGLNVQRKAIFESNEEAGVDIQTKAISRPGVELVEAGKQAESLVTPIVQPKSEVSASEQPAQEKDEEQTPELQTKPAPGDTVEPSGFEAQINSFGGEMIAQAKSANSSVSELQKQEEEQTTEEEPEWQPQPVMESGTEPPEADTPVKSKGEAVVQAKSDASGGVELHKQEEEQTAEAEPELQTQPVFENSAEPVETEAKAKPVDLPTAPTKNVVAVQEERIQQEEEEGIEEESDVQLNPIFDANAEPPDESGLSSVGVADNVVQRPCAESVAEEENTKPEIISKEVATIQAKADTPPSASTANLQSRLNNSKGGGQPLSEDTRESMESGFGADFSGVRVHTGGEAAQMNKELGAHAFTHGSDIYFNEGKYDTGSTKGKKLLAHELTHTVQQSAVQVKKAEDRRTARADDVQLARIQHVPQYDNATIQRNDNDQGIDDKGVWFIVPFRDEFVTYYDLGLSSEASEYFTLNPESLVLVWQQLVAVFNPDGDPLHETMYFLESQRIKHLVTTDLNRWATQRRMPALSSLIQSRHAALKQQRLLYDLEQWLESNSVVPNPALNWPVVLQQIRAIGTPFPIVTLVDASDYDRFEMFLTMLDNEYHLLGYEGGYDQVDAMILQQKLSDYLLDILPREAFIEETQRLHSEKFLDNYLSDIIPLQFVPDDFDISAFEPVIVQEEINRERARLIDIYINNLGPEYMAVYILNDWIESGMSAHDFLANLNIDAYRAELVAFMADEFFNLAKKEPNYKFLLMYEAYEKTSYQTLFGIYLGAQSQKLELDRIIDNLYTKPVADLNEEERAVAQDPGAYAHTVQVLSQASLGFFEEINRGKQITSAALTRASEIVTNLELPPVLVGLQFLVILGSSLKHLEDIYAEQEQKARNDISQIVTINYDQIANQVNNWVEYAENYIEKDFLPMLKTVAFDRIEANRKALQYAYDNWETESANSAARFRIAALVLQDIADKLRSKEIESIDLQGTLLTAKDLPELKTTIKILNKEAEKHENPKSSKQIKAKIQEALDGFQKVKKGIEDGDYDPLDYGDAVYREAMDRLGIGRLPEIWRGATVRDILRGPVVVNDHILPPAIANKNPFFYFAITWWEWRERSERAIKQYMIAMGIGLLSLTAILAPVAAGAGLIGGAAATIITGLDLAVGISIGVKGVLDAKELLRMARLDTNGSVYGVSPEAAEKALTHAWINLGVSLILTAGVGALYGVMAIRGRGSTMNITSSMTRLHELVKINPKLAQKLLKMVKDAEKLDTLLDIVNDPLTLERLLNQTKDLRNLKYLLMMADGQTVSALLSKVENAAQLARVFDNVFYTRDAIALVDFVGEFSHLRPLLNSANGVRTLQVVRLCVTGGYRTLAIEANIIGKIQGIISGNRVFDTDLAIIIINSRSSFPANDKLFNLNNLLDGLVEATRRHVPQYNEIINTLRTRNSKFDAVIDTLCYTQYKGRWEFFTIIYDAKVNGLYRSLPRGFKNEAHFHEFSQAIRSILIRYGAKLDMRIQGSSLLDLPGPVKDIDIAVMMEKNDFLKAMKKAFAVEYFRYKTGLGAPIPPSFFDSISDAEFLAFLDNIRSNGRNAITLTGKKVNSEMLSAVRAYDNGLLKDSKFLNSAEKRLRAQAQASLGIEFDLSIVQKGKTFDRGPFLQLTH